MSESSASNPSAVTTLSLKPGDKVDSFTVVDTIATTGSAVVYKAHDELLDRHVAIKQIILGDGDTEAALRKRIREEAAIHKRLSTAQPKHLIQFIDAVDDERGLMLVSEYYLSTSLEDLLNQKSGPMDERQALGIVAATAKGLAAIHQAGVVHRDLKPSNILLGEDGGLKICDFGLSALVEAQESLSLGSVRYMAPELLKSEPADGRADLYSLGIIAYEMLAGRQNFDVAFRNVLRDQRNQAMRWMKWHTNLRVAAPHLDEYLADLPMHLTQLVARMMDKDQTRRVGSAEDVLEAIRRHFTGDGPDESLTNGRSRDLPATATSSAGDTAPLPVRSKLPIILAGLLGFWILVGATLYIVNENKKTAALNRAIAESEALIRRGIDLYDEGKYAEALENYRLVVADRPEDSLQAKQAQLGIWKTEGRRAFNAGLYSEAINFFQQYIDNGGQDQSVENVIEEAKDAESFKSLTADIEQNVDALKFREATQFLKDARETELTDAQLATLDELETFIGQRRAEALADERIAEARTLLAQGDLPTAIAALEDLASLPPEGQDLLDKLKSDLAYNQAMDNGEEALRQGSLGQAIDAFTAALALRPDDRLADRVRKLDARRLTEEGALLFERGQYDEAGRRFVEALEKDPANTDALRLSRQITAATELSTIERAGDAAAARGDFAGAVTKFEEALELAPENATIQSKLNNVRVSYNTQRARQAMSRKDFEGARELLDVAALLAPDDNSVKVLLAELDLQERYHTLLSEGKEALATKDYRTAKRKFVDARKLLPGDEVEQWINETDFLQYIARAREYMAEGQYDAAGAMLDQARKLRPANPVLIELLTELERLDAAASDNE